jgi:hypothetical protein
MGPVHHADGVQALLGAGQTLLAADAAIDQGQRDVLDRIVAREQIVGLEYEADAAGAQGRPVVFREIGDVRALEIERALARQVE